VTDRILSLADLRKISGLHQPAAIERWMRREGIAFKSSANGPWTTIDAVNAALGAGAATTATDDGYGAEVA
jgi:hypothetical protein